MALWLFVLGLAVGSFVNVVALRYDPERFLLARDIIGGRSHCPRCGRTLAWYELIPVVSFALQRGRCRSCAAKISPQYLLVEILSGLIFVFTYGAVVGAAADPRTYLVAALWIAVFITLLILTLIDMRLHLIPDEASIFLGILGIGIAFLTAGNFGITSGSFFGSYAAIFGFRESLFFNRMLAFFAAAGFFGALVLGTRGRGMGLGDVKLAGALGLLFGWPDVALIIALAFIIGAIVGVFMMLRREKTIKSALPFGPFLALGSALVFFFGSGLAATYFGLLAGI